MGIVVDMDYGYGSRLNWNTVIDTVKDNETNDFMRRFQL